MEVLDMKHTIMMSGRRWFDRVNGNTYHSVEVYVDHKFLDRTDFAYGYDDGYRQTGFELLQKHGIYKPDAVYHDMELDKRDFRDAFVFIVTDVGRKKDL